MTPFIQALKLLFSILLVILTISESRKSFRHKNIKNYHDGVNTTRNPFDQGLPNCKLEFQRISKKTNAKAMLCPMFR